jgi:hypothetical protein
LTLAELERMSETDIKNIEKTKLSDIKNITPDMSKSLSQRMEIYLEQIKNPYCFLCGDSVVKIHFEEGGQDLKNHLKNYFLSIKND